MKKNDEKLILATVEDAILSLVVEDMGEKTADLVSKVVVVEDLASRFELSAELYHALKRELNVDEGAMHRKLMANPEYKLICDKLAEAKKHLSGKFKACHTTSVQIELDRLEEQRQQILVEKTKQYNSLIAEELTNFDPDVLALLQENEQAWNEFKGENK